MRRTTSDCVGGSSVEESDEGWVAVKSEVEVMFWEEEVGVDEKSGGWVVGGGDEGGGGVEKRVTSSVTSAPIGRVTTVFSRLGVSSLLEEERKLLRK